MSFQGLSVWITGGGSGIGRALALELARQGADVAVSGRREARLAEGAAEIAALGKAVEASGSHDATKDSLTRLQGALGKELDGIGTSIGGLTSRLAAVDARMSDLEARPATGTPKEFTEAFDALRGQLADAEADEDAAQPLDLLEGEDLVLRQERIPVAEHLCRHAVGAA